MKTIIVAAALSLMTGASYAQEPHSMFDSPLTWNPTTWHIVCSSCGPQQPQNTCRQSFKMLCAGMEQYAEETGKNKHPPSAYTPHSHPAPTPGHGTCAGICEP